ncbi:MAG TPA: membrane protein insertion efficiency factor YidD [Longimicrobium sp.]|nr:membrane protein insertion efficiency factor YidD [Longimicrobium sp.]
MLARILTGAIRFYQKGISPLKPPVCRFVPSCSQYGVEAIERHGAAKGSWLLLKRLARCQPFCRGGYDPVP